MALASIGRAETGTSEPLFPVTIDGVDGYIGADGKIGSNHGSCMRGALAKASLPSL
jgi:hypothetical protein